LRQWRKVGIEKKLKWGAEFTRGTREKTLVIKGGVQFFSECERVFRRKRSHSATIFDIEGRRTIPSGKERGQNMENEYGPGDMKKGSGQVDREGVGGRGEREARRRAPPTWMVGDGRGHQEG